MSTFNQRAGLIRPTALPLIPMSSITQQGSATALSGATITAPATIIAGDIHILSQYSTDNAFSGNPVDVTPPGWTTVANAGASGDEGRIMLSWKIADGSEASAIITGMNAPNANLKAIYVFRGDAPATTVQVKDVNAQVSFSGNPAAQVKNVAAETAPLVVIGAYGTDPSASTALNPRSFTPGPKDGEVNPSTFHYLAYKIFNSSPVDQTIDMDDEGFVNALASFYFVPFHA